MFTYKRIIFFLLSISPLYAQGFELSRCRESSIIIYHDYYEEQYNTEYHIPEWVGYKLKSDMLTDPKRLDYFHSENYSASNDDYTNSGYDRGHLAPAADMSFSDPALYDSFSMLNVAPQTAALNRGTWLELENKIREWAEEYGTVYVVSGPAINLGLSGEIDGKIGIPEYYYKAIFHDDSGIAFLIPNVDPDSDLSEYAISIDSLEEKTGIDFFYTLPDNQENKVESIIDKDLKESL